MTWRLQQMVYETLVTTNENLEIVPALAASWTQPDETTYVFSLEPGVTFSNGRSMTADDVVGSLQRLIDPATASYWAPQLGPVESITATDPATVEVKLSAPYEPFLAALANVSAAVLPDGGADRRLFRPDDADARHRPIRARRAPARPELDVRPKRRVLAWRSAGRSTESKYESFPTTQPVSPRFATAAFTSPTSPAPTRRRCSRGPTELT